MSIATEPISPEWRNLRARKAANARYGNAEEAERLDTELRTERLADFIKRTAEAAPPLTEEQRRRLAAILRGGGAA